VLLIGAETVSETGSMNLSANKCR